MHPFVHFNNFFAHMEANLIVYFAQRAGVLPFSSFFTRVTPAPVAEPAPGYPEQLPGLCH